MENEIIKSKNAKYMFLYLYYVNRENLDLICNEILKTKNYKYIHFLLRTFKPNNYNLILDYILLTNNDSRYLFNILYDVDYLPNDYRLKIIDKVILLGDKIVFSVVSTESKETVASYLLNILSNYFTDNIIFTRQYYEDGYIENNNVFDMCAGKSS